MSISSKLLLIDLAGIMLAATGVYLRFNAHSLVWPLSYTFSGPWEDTDWGRQQIALEQCSLILIAFGTGLLLLACHRWLRLTEADYAADSEDGTDSENAPPAA